MPSSRSRDISLDVAKGAAIVAVVYVHVVGKHLLATPSLVSDSGSLALQVFADGLAPVRMPLFFFISGGLGAGALSRSWSSLTASKVSQFYYVYVVWLLLHTALLSLLGTNFNTRVARTPDELLAQMLWDPSTLWYLYALAIFFPLAKVLPVNVFTVGCAAIMSAASFTDLVAPNMLAGLQRNLVWFLLGVLLFRRGLKTSLISPWAGRLALGSGGALAVLLMGMFKFTSFTPVLYTVASAVGICLGLALALLCLRSWRFAARWLAGVGNETLGVYVLHIPFVALCDFAIRSLTMSFPTATALPYAGSITIGVVLLSLATSRLLRRHLPWSLRAPWLRPATTPNVPTAAPAGGSR